MQQLLKPARPRAGAPQQEKLLQWGARVPQLEKDCAQQQRLGAAINKQIDKILSPNTVIF